MPMQWKDSGDAKLIVAIAATHRLNYTAIAAALGEECSVRAVQERVKMHRRDIRRAKTEDGCETKSTHGDQKENTKDIPKRVIEHLV